MKYYLFIFFLSVSSIFGAESIYITDQTSGGDTGVDAANAHSVSWFNTSGNWDIDDATDGLIGPGDTVWYVGVITNAVIVQGSGATNNPITFKISPGARFSHPYWSGSGAFQATGKGNFILEGGNTGEIVTSNWTQIDFESTANGTALANQVAGTKHIAIVSGHNITIKNLISTNVYVRTPHHPTDFTGSASAISLSGGNNLLITNCAVFNAENGCTLSAVGSNEIITNLWVKKFLAMHVANGVRGVGLSGSGVIVRDCGVVDSRIDYLSTWDGMVGEPHYHCDGIQPTSIVVGSYVDGMIVARNNIGPNMGNTMTAHVFIEDYHNRPMVVNNLLTMNTPDSMNGFIVAGTHQSLITNTIIDPDGDLGLIAYNTIVATNTTTAIGALYSRIIGNISSDVGAGISISHGSLIDTWEALHGPIMIDTNYYHSMATAGSGVFRVVDTSGVYNGSLSWLRWTNSPRAGQPDVAMAFDRGSLGIGGGDNDPLFASNYSVRPGSPAHAKGANLTGYYGDSRDVFIQTDLRGQTRPSSGLWTLGAFQGTNSSGGAESPAVVNGRISGGFNLKTSRRGR